MIDNFAPQPYPLECSVDRGYSWWPVIGWRPYEDSRLAPVIATPEGGLTIDLGQVSDQDPLQIRLAGAPATAIAARSTVLAPSRSARAESTSRRPTSA